MASGETPTQNVQDYPEASEEFMIYSFKVLPCCKGYRHNWKRCPFAHEGESERRRDPRIFNYTAVVCPATKKGVQCPRGDKCPWAHNVFEYWLHPQRFRTEMCSKKDTCKRRFCFFAHEQSELRVCGTKKSKQRGSAGSGSQDSSSSDSPIASMLNLPSLPLPSEATTIAQFDVDLLGGASLVPDSGSMWGMAGGVKTPSRDAGLYSTGPTTMLRDEIHDSMASIPGIMGWDKLASLYSPRQDFQNNAPSSQVPELYIPPPPPPADRFSPRQPTPACPTRVSPRQQFGGMLTPRQVLEEEIGLGLFSPRPSFTAQQPSTGINRFSPRRSLQEELGSPPPLPPGWGEALGANALNSILHDGWSMSPVGQEQAAMGPFAAHHDTDTAGLLQSIQILRNLNLGVNLEGKGHGLGAPLASSREDALRDHLSFFMSP